MSKQRKEVDKQHSKFLHIRLTRSEFEALNKHSDALKISKSLLVKRELSKYLDNNY